MYEVCQVASALKLPRENYRFPEKTKAEFNRNVLTSLCFAWPALTGAASFLYGIEKVGPKKYDIGIFCVDYVGLQAVNFTGIIMAAIKLTLV